MTIFEAVDKRLGVNSSLPTVNRFVIIDLMCTVKFLAKQIDELKEQLNKVNKTNDVC